MIFKEFINWCGNGNFPQTECGVTSSYLATIVYFDIIDNRLYNLLSKEKTIKEFKICRYVDDLYILLDIDGRINTDKLENKISSIYEYLIYDYNLSINRKKSNFNKTENIFNDLKSFYLNYIVVLKKKIGKYLIVLWHCSIYYIEIFHHQSY